MSMSADAFCSQLSALEAYSTPACTQSRPASRPRMTATVVAMRFTRCARLRVAR